MKNLFKTAVCSIFLIASIAQADVTISDAWVRANAPGQSVGAAYMTLKKVRKIAHYFA